MTDMSDDTPSLTVKDVAKLLGMSGSFVYEVARANLIRHERRGKAYRFSRQAVEEYRRANSHGPQGDSQQ